jgi:hypothetical protein
VDPQKNNKKMTINQILENIRENGTKSSPVNSVNLCEMEQNILPSTSSNTNETSVLVINNSSKISNQSQQKEENQNRILEESLNKVTLEEKNTRSSQVQTLETRISGNIRNTAIENQELVKNINVLIVNLNVIEGKIFSNEHNQKIL